VAHGTSSPLFLLIIVQEHKSAHGFTAIIDSVFHQSLYFFVFPALCVWFGAFVKAQGALLASRQLHYELLANCLRIPMVFFDTTPLGRILNRFSKDIDTVDTAIPMTAGMWLMCVCNVAAMLVVIGFSTPYFLLVAAVLSVFYVMIQVRAQNDQPLFLTSHQVLCMDLQY
jgi:ABC-type multidrug transport system fused ATPase/permease subunit